MREPKIISRPAFTVIGMKQRGKPQEIDYGALWEAFMPRVDEIQGVINSNSAYGVCENSDPATQEFDYLAAVEVAGETHVPEGMVQREVPAQTYAVFACTLPTIAETWQRASETWLPQSGRQYGPGPDFEFYPETFDPSQPGSEMFLYLPVN